MTVTHRRIDGGPAGGFDLHVHDSGRPGPRAVVLGGVHGDETEGALAAGRLASSNLALIAGRVDVVPVCHEVAFAADSRTSPIDGGNLARVFPGDPAGSATACLAHHIFTEVLDGADFLIDLHTSGRGYEMPFLAGYRGATPDPDSMAGQAATAFGADFVWRHPGASEGRTVSVVENAIYVESPGGGPTDPAMVDSYHQGVMRVLAELDMMTGVPRPSSRSQIRVAGGGDLDRDMISVGHNGVFLASVSPGDRLESGDLIGQVIDIAGGILEEHRAEDAGYVMALKRRSPVREGDLIVCIASDDSH